MDKLKISSGTVEIDGDFDQYECICIDHWGRKDIFISKEDAQALIDHLTKALSNAE